MNDFNLNEYLAQLEESESISLCPKVPRPKVRDDQSYIFISYAHADYKQVYKALAYMYARGVRFWYDSGLTAGLEWDGEVKAVIRHPNCSGAIFFLSENLFLSRSVINTELPCILGIDVGATLSRRQCRLIIFRSTLPKSSRATLYSTLCPSFAAAGSVPRG